MDRRVPGDEDGLAPDRRLSRGPLALAAATLLPFLLLAAWARLTPVSELDLQLLSGLALGSGPWADLVRGINRLGDLPVWAVLVGLLAVGALTLRAYAAAALIALSLFSDVAAFAFKVLVGRARPETIATEHFFGVESFAFPSGHVVRAVALLAALAWIVAPARWRLPSAIVAGTASGLMMGYARVALGVHWPTDALGGLLLGLGWLALSALIVWQPAWRRPRAGPDS